MVLWSTPPATTDVQAELLHTTWKVPAKNISTFHLSSSSAMLEVINSQVWSSSTGHMLRDSFYQFLQNLEAIKYNKCQDAPLGGLGDTAQQRKWWTSGDKVLTNILPFYYIMKYFKTRLYRKSKSIKISIDSLRWHPVFMRAVLQDITVSESCQHC